MIDIENQPSNQTNIMSLRKRKNPQSLSTAREKFSESTDYQQRKQKLQQHSRLVKDINSATGDDDDDDVARKMKQMIMKEQLKQNNQMAKSLNRFLFVILISLIILYGIAISNVPTDEPSIMNSLSKVLRILLGMKNNQNYLSSSQIVSSSSVSELTMEDFLIPTWPWSSEKKYLVPDSYSSVKHILHESVKLKYQYGLNIDLFDKEKMRNLLVQHGHECSNQTRNQVDTSLIVQKFDELKGINNYGQKYLWLWCMMYSGEKVGHLDIDNHMIQLTANLLRKLSLGSKPYGIENILVNPKLKGDAKSVNTLNSAPTTLLSLSTSILFVSTPKSRVAEGMLQFMLQSSFDEEALVEELIRQVESAGITAGATNERQENWVLLNAHCTNAPNNEVEENMLARVCSSYENSNDNEMQQCCYLIL